MFSSSVEVVLTIAYREAVSRRHAYVTLEHLLYALAHDVEGERILEACGVDLPKLRRDLDTYLNESIEQFPRRERGEPEQTAAFRRVLQAAVLHVQSAQRAEVQAGDIILKFGGRRTMVGVDLYNVMNSGTVLTYNNAFVPGGPWLPPNSILTPRLARISAEFTF